MINGHPQETWTGIDVLPEWECGVNGTDASEEGFGLHGVRPHFHVVQRLEVNGGRGQ